MKRLINLTLCLSLSFTMLLGLGLNLGATYASEYRPEVNTRAAILIDIDSNQVLYDNNSTKRMPVASIVKLMTIMLTFEHIQSGTISLHQASPIHMHFSGV